MQIFSLVFGILAMIGMFVGFIPCLGAYNWLNIPFAAVGIIVSGVALATTKEGSKTGSIIGLIACGVAIMLGLLRLIMGGGVL
jgi:hypothetical protein